METESLNWFRFAQCLVTLGNEVLQRLLKFNIQTCCFSEYHKLWLDKVNVHCRSNHLKLLWDSFDQQYRGLDASSQQILQPLLVKWKSNCGPMTMEIRQQLSVLKEWEDELQDFITNNTTQQNTLKKWSSEIQILDSLNASLWMLIKQWTQDFINLCQVDQLELVHLTERHHENTNVFLAAFLKELALCIRQSPGELDTILKTFQQKEVNLLHILQTEAQAFFISWQPKIEELLNMWITLTVSSPHQQILHNLVTDVKNILPRVHQMCQTELQNISITWHSNLKKMLTEWDSQLQQVGASAGDIQDLAKTWDSDLQAFPPASDQQIRDFFDSRRHYLQTLKSRQIITNPQWSLLYPTHGHIDIQTLDITILSTLHRNVFPICPPEYGWSGQVFETDHSLGADLMRLRKFRNDYFGHIPVPTLITCEFEKLWTILEASLRRLSTALDYEFKEKVNRKIAQLKICPFDFTENMNLQLELNKHIQSDILDLVGECRIDVHTINEEVKNLPQKDAFIKERIDGIEKAIIRVEKCVSKPIDSLSRTEMLDGMECIIERINRLESRMTRIESSQKINRCKLEERIDLMRARIELHKMNNSDVHVITRGLHHARDILFKEKHIVLKGKPGEGKTHLALFLVADLIERNKEISPVEINNTQEWDEMVDTRQRLVVFLDDVLGKYGVSETDLDRWKKISEVIHPRFSGSSIFLIVCIRTQIASFIKLSLRRNEPFFMFNSSVVDISAEPHRLTKAEREQMLKKYIPKFVDRNETSETKDIVEMENVIGFAQNCKLAGSIQNLSVDMKELFSNNMFLIEEIQDMSKKSPEIYTFLVLLMLSGGCLSLENKQKELNNKLKTLSDQCGFKMLYKKEMKNIGHSLCGTLLEYTKKRQTFKFQHDCTETAVFVSFGKDYPDIILEHCSLKQLSKMCCVANELDRLDGEDFLSFKVMIRDDHFRVMFDRFNEGLESGGRDSFKSIAEGLVWKNQSFVNHFSNTMALGDNVLNFLTKTDPDGHSLLIHLVNAKSTLAVQGIIKNISQCGLQNNDIAARQLLIATTNACLTEEKRMLNDFIKLREKVDDFVMLAAASTGNVSIMKMLVLQGGNIHATISIKQTHENDLSNTINNCISYPRISPYHHDINLFHIACRYGLTDMVKYLMNNYPELVYRTSNLGRTAVHFLAYSENVELMKVLCAEPTEINDDTKQLKNNSQLDILARDNDGTTVLHIAAAYGRLPIVKYLIENNRQLMFQNDNDGWTAMHYAAAGGSVPVIEALLNAGLDINVRTSVGAHVLHIAAWNDNLSIVKYLIQNNPPLILQNDNDGWTAMHYAAAGGSVPVIEALIQTGLDINERTKKDTQVLHIAARDDNLPIVKYLIKNSPQLILQNKNDGWTSIHSAAAGGSVPVIEALIQAGLDINARTNVGADVLHIAARNGNLPIVKYLIENNPPLILQNDNDGWTAMHYATKGGNLPVIQALIQAGLDINAKTNDDSHVLHIAAGNDNLTIVKYLIENNLPLILQNDNDGWTAMHYAAAGGSFPVIEALIQAGLDINARTNVGADVLHIAARNGNLPIVKYLIENNPPLILQNDNDGWTAMHYATKGGNLPVIQALIQAGLDINAKTNDDSHVLHIAAGNDNLTIVKYLIENNLPLILQNDNDGWTAMHYAAAGGSFPVIEALIQAGLDINARTNNDSHVLHIAAGNDNLPIVKYLIENNRLVILQNDIVGLTAMHYAAKGGSVPVIEALIQAGFDINARTNVGAHVLHIAARNENLSVVKYVIENHPPLLLQNDDDGWTAMHYAAEGGSVPVFEALIQAGFDINARTNVGAHVLHIASRNNNLPIVKYLIENNPPLILLHDNDGRTAMHYVAERGSVPLLDFLIQAGLDINTRTNDDSHVLHIAAGNNNLPIVKYFIVNNLVLTLENNNNGWTTIHYAAKGGSVPVIEILIIAGLDINAKTNNGANVLHIAALNDKLLIVEYLIENNPPLILQNDNNGWNAMHYAAAGGSVPVIEALIKTGLDINARTNAGAHVLHIAAGNDNLQVVEYLIVINLTVRQDNDNDGRTAMHYAAEGGSVPLMETLIMAGLDINARTNNGANVLHIAAGTDNLPVVEYVIIMYPTMISEKDNDGWTALDYAYEGDSFLVLETLKQGGLALMH